MVDQLIKNTARRSAEKAGGLAIREYRKSARPAASLKSHHEIVTKTDLRSEKLIVAEIRRRFPDHEILSEETGLIKGKNDWLWIIDPIDGTTNFYIHNPLWAISIAVAYRRALVFGLVYAPALKELFQAEAGGGAFLNGRPIGVSPVNRRKVINTFCHGRAPRHVRRAVDYYRIQKEKELDCRQLGSASLELAYVAAGRTESIVIPGANLWDVAAGVLIVREAGGRVTDWRGREWGLSSPDMAATNGRVHNKILRVLERI